MIRPVCLDATASGLMMANVRSISGELYVTHESTVEVAFRQMEAGTS